MIKKGDIMLLITIVERGRGKKLIKFYEEQNIFYTFQCMGIGTASSELLDVLGIGTAEKDITISYSDYNSIRNLFQIIEEETCDFSFGKGLAISLSIQALNSLVIKELLNQNLFIMGEHEMNDSKQCLVLITVNQGNTDEVMNTARQAGAKGGTIIQARWAGPDSGKQIYGMSIQTEKEVIAIVIERERRNTLMEVINKKHGSGTEAGAILCSLEIEDKISLS